MPRVHRIAAIAGIEQGSIPAILIFAVVSTCFQKIYDIAVIGGVVHSDPNDPNDYIETRHIGSQVKVEETFMLSMQNPFFMFCRQANCVKIASLFPTIHAVFDDLFLLYDIA